MKRRWGAIKATHCRDCGQSFDKVERQVYRRTNKRTGIVGITNTNRCKECTKAYNRERSRSYRLKVRPGKGTKKVRLTNTTRDMQPMEYLKKEKRIQKLMKMAEQELPLDHSPVYL